MAPLRSKLSDEAHSWLWLNFQTMDVSHGLLSSQPRWLVGMRITNGLATHFGQTVDVSQYSQTLGTVDPVAAGSSMQESDTSTTSRIVRK